MSAGFDTAFRHILGESSMQPFLRRMSDRPVILLSGDQATGKTTAARSLAKRFGGKAKSAGSFVRGWAEDEGIAFEEMNRRMAADPKADVHIDHACALAVATGEVSVFEGRLAGQIGSFLRPMGRANLYSVCLTCPPLERALRWVERETSSETRARAAAKLALPPGTSFETCVAALRELGGGDLRQVLDALTYAASRDEQDRQRLLALYGVDYTDRSVFNLLIDTSKQGPDATVDLIRRACPREH